MLSVGLKKVLGFIYITVMSAYISYSSYILIDHLISKEEVAYVDSRDVDIYKYAAPSIKVWHYIKKYSSEYSIPPKIAFGVARLETGYRKPLDFKYKHNQISYAKAYGPMQVQLPTAQWVMQDNSITAQDLINNIDLNVKISMKYLRILHNRYKSWDLALGYYNTGYSQVNDYAVKILASL